MPKSRYRQLAVCGFVVAPFAALAGVVLVRVGLGLSGVLHAPKPCLLNLLRAGYQWDGEVN